MPINNITQTISELPAAGRRGVDVQTQFVTKQEDFQDHLQGTTVTELNTFKNQLNTRIGEINSTTTTMNGYANTASAGASTATTKAGEASTSAGEALTSRNQANTFATNSSNSATKASQWADNNYNVAVETGKYSAKHWSTIAQNASINKVDKVTSTDNAIVRFDGTTGAVQNSGVIIDDAGNLLIGASGGAGVIQASSAIYSWANISNFTYIVNQTVSGSESVFVGMVGGVVKAAILSNGTYQSATNVYGSTSDIKLKENVVDTTPKLDKLMQVQVRNFNYIGQEDKQIGVIAQEIEQIFPSVVFETKDTKQVEVTKERVIPALEELKDDDGNITQEAKPEIIEEYTEIETVETGEVTKNVKYSIIYMMMLKGLQELNDIVVEQKNKISLLEDKLQRIEDGQKM